MSVLFAYSWGGLVYDALYAQIMHDGNQAGAQMHKDELMAWTSSNTNTNVPKYVNNNIFVKFTSIPRQYGDIEF